MPKDKLTSLKEERRKLANKSNLTPYDDRRLQNLDRLIRKEENSNSRPQDPWDPRIRVNGKLTGRSARSADMTSVVKAQQRDQLRMQFGMGPLASMGFISPNDAGDALVVNPDLAGYQFGPSQAKSGWTGAMRSMGSTALKGAVAKTPGGRTIDAMNGMSVQNVLDFYYSLDDAELIKFQTELVEAGLLEKPQLGFRDQSTTQALGVLMSAWISEPTNDLRSLLGKMKQANSARMDEEARKLLGEGSSGVGVISDEVANVTFTDTQTLDTMIDRVSVNLFGQRIDDATKQALISQLQQEEIAYKSQNAQMGFAQDVASQQAQMKAASGSTDLDAFMDALIGKESGGNPNAVNPDSGAIGLGQIMPENWEPWAREAGADPRDFSEANQRKIIKYKLAQYYTNYGNWRDVALAWYGGHGGVLRVRAGGGNAAETYGANTYDSLNQYADSVMAKMNANIGSALGAGGTTPQLSIVATEDMADPQTRAEARLKSIRPDLYYGSEFAKQAAGFEALLGGVN